MDFGLESLLDWNLDFGLDSLLGWKMDSGLDFGLESSLG